MSIKHFRNVAIGADSLHHKADTVYLLCPS